MSPCVVTDVIRAAADGVDALKVNLELREWTPPPHKLRAPLQNVLKHVSVAQVASQLKCGELRGGALAAEHLFRSAVRSKDWEIGQRGQKIIHVLVAVCNDGV